MKSYDQPRSILKSRDISWLTKVPIVKAMIFPVVMYGCESWTIKKAECQRLDALELWCWRSLLKAPWTSRSSNQSVLKEISPEYSLAAAAAVLLQSCPTLCDPIDGSPPGSPVPGILQARTRVGCHFLLQCREWKVKVKSLSHVRLLATPWTTAYQAPPSMGFSRQEYWSGVPSSSPMFTGGDSNTLATWCKELMHREKTLMLGKIEGRKRGWQRTRWLHDIMNSMAMSLRKLRR